MASADLKGMVEGEGFVTPVQALVLLDPFLEMFQWHHAQQSTLYNVARTPARIVHSPVPS